MCNKEKIQNVYQRKFPNEEQRKMSKCVTKTNFKMCNKDKFPYI